MPRARFVVFATSLIFAAVGVRAENPGTSKLSAPKPGAQSQAAQNTDPPNAGAQDDPPAVISALFIYRFIVNRLAFLEECAQIDRPNVSAYSEAFSNFSLDATPIADRTFAILHEESARAKESSDSFSRRMFDIGRQARRLLMDNAAKNSMAFTIGCREVPPAMREHAEGFRPIRSQFPEQMRVIDAGK